ncbi:MAG: PKD domain-containing protein, partial [Saprospiraceae bacterium]
ICISDIIPSGGIDTTGFSNGGNNGNGGNGSNGNGNWSYGYGGFCYTDTAGIYRCGGYGSYGFYGSGGNGNGGNGGIGGNIISNNGVVDTIEGAVFNNNSDFLYISGCTPLTVTFKDSSTVFPATTTLSYLWHFGDGGTSTEQNPTHTYYTPTNGSVYMVSVRVTTSTGIVRTDTLNTFVRPTTPYTSFFASKDSVCIDESIDFLKTLENMLNSAIDFINKTSGIELSYKWDFDNGDTAISRDTTYAFDTAGVYNVCLTVTDFNGCDSVFCKKIWVLEPTANFAADVTSSNCDTLTVNFMNTSTNADSVLWNFGVLGIDTAHNPTVVFGDPGNYTVCLTAVNTIGCAQIKCDTNLISVNGPVLDAYSFSPQATCIPANIEFVAAGQNIKTYKWIPQIGDTITSVTGFDTDTTIYTYNAVDTFYPQLIIEDSLGCQRHVFLDSIITTNPKAIFTLDTLAGCAPLTVVANANASTFAESYQWQSTGAIIFNGSSATPSIRYNNSGEYDSLRLVITDFTGCQDTFYLPDTITASDAFAGFSMDTTTGCVPLTINFTDTSSTFSDSIISYLWDFGDGFSSLDTSSQKNPTYTYNNVPNNHGTNTVRLTVTTQNGCSDVITKTVRPTFPSVSFTLDTFVCTGQTVNFNNQSSGVNIGYAWNFGDGNTSIIRTPTHSYVNEGVFNVCLTVTDKNGCDSTYCDSVRVANPVASFFAPTPFIACPPDTVCFVDQSLNAVAWEWDFGDQSVSSIEQNPCHVYIDPGKYTITLIVTSLSG